MALYKPSLYPISTSTALIVLAMSQTALSIKSFSFCSLILPELIFASILSMYGT
jgi:hypothetical protein